MKVKIRDLTPNPFRDMGHYPIDAVRVENLANSIKQTGFWDNILARKSNGSIQIAYGHHRLAAIKKVMSPSDSVDIPVKELDDATMLKIMANENMFEWRTNPGVIDETVLAARKFLDEHPSEVRKLGQLKSASIGADFVSRFLGWDRNRVIYSLERLRLIEEEVLNSDAVWMLPNEGSARSFVAVVKKYKPTKLQQRRIVDEIIDKENFGMSVFEAVTVNELRQSPKKEKAQVQRFEDFILGVAKDMAQLKSKFEKLREFKHEFNSKTYRETFERLSFEVAWRDLNREYKQLIEEVTSEKRTRRIQAD